MFPIMRRGSARARNEALHDQIFFTTKNTKATKVSDIDIFKLLNFVLFVTFVVKFFSSLVAAYPRLVSAVKTNSDVSLPRR